MLGNSGHKYKYIAPEQGQAGNEFFSETFAAICLPLNDFKAVCSGPDPCILLTFTNQMHRRPHLTLS